MDRSHKTTLGGAIMGTQEGDTYAFRIVFEDMSDRLFAYTLAHTKNRDDSLDIVQETFIDFWAALPKFEYQSDEAVYGFVFTILKRKLYKNYRTGNKTISLEQIDVYEEDPLREDYRHLHKHVNTLIPKYRELLRLRYWLHMSFSEIANTLHIKESTAKVWHHRAIRKLKGTVEKYD